MCVICDVKSETNSSQQKRLKQTQNAFDNWSHGCWTYVGSVAVYDLVFSYRVHDKALNVDQNDYGF